MHIEFTLSFVILHPFECLQHAFPSVLCKELGVVAWANARHLAAAVFALAFIEVCQEL
jgi:hypothetical protein